MFFGIIDNRLSQRYAFVEEIVVRLVAEGDESAADVESSGSGRGIEQ
jgi:hypothetical protein